MYSIYNILNGALSQVVCQDHFQWVDFQFFNSALHQMSYNVYIALINGPLNLNTFYMLPTCQYTFKNVTKWMASFSIHEQIRIDLHVRIWDSTGTEQNTMYKSIRNWMNFRWMLKFPNCGYAMMALLWHYMHILNWCYCEELCATVICTKDPGQFFNSAEQGHLIWICSRVCFGRVKPMYGLCIQILLIFF
jgi:hypothetical protein